MNLTHYQKATKAIKSTHISPFSPISRIMLASAFSACFHTLSALEFGQMGNISAGMGGAGVALKNSQWGLYYNPSLLALNKKSGFAYSFGIGYKETNLTRLATIDMANLQAMPAKLASIFGNVSSALGNTITAASSLPIPANTLATSSFNAQNLGVFGSVLEGMGMKDDTSMKNYLDKVAQNNGVNISNNNATPQALLQNLQQNPNALNQIKQDLQSAIDTTAAANPDQAASLGLLGGIVSGLTADNIGDLLQSVSSGTVDLDSLLRSMGNITLLASDDVSLNQFVKDMGILHDIVRNNDLSISTQNGVIINVGSQGARGSIGFGILPSAYLSATAKMDATHNNIIMQQGDAALRVDFLHGDILIGATTTDEFTKSSLLSPEAQHQIHLASIGIIEVPVGYGHLFETPIGDIGVGGALKYIFGTGYTYNKQGGFDVISQNLAPTFAGIPQTHTFGIDIGASYVPRVAKNLTLGLVAKNLNMPKITTDALSGATTQLNAQLRSGVSYSWLDDKIVLAGDVDLLPNDTISLSRPLSQVAGGGVLLDFKWVDVRLGAMYDFRNNGDEGMILTGGLNILGYLDIVAQSNFHISQEIFGSISLPSYLLVKIGGGFSW